DRQRVEAERPPQLGHQFGWIAPALRLMGRAPSGNFDELCLEDLMRFPQLPIVDALDPFPEPRVSSAKWPVGPEVTVVDLPHLRRQPAWHVDTVGDVPDRDAVFTALGEQPSPHASRDLSVQ